MKKITLIIAALGVVMVSCSDDHDEPTADQLSPFAKQYIGMQFGNPALSSFGRDNATGTLANESFRLLHNTAAVSGGRKSEDSDSTIYIDPWHWQTCAIITVTENEDRSTTTTTDYGEGCPEGAGEYQYWRYGKQLYTTRNSLEKEGSVLTHAYVSSWSAENLGGAYYWDGDTTSWNSNGYSHYEGTSEYDTVAHTYIGKYSMHGDMTYMWDDVVYRNIGNTVTTYTDTRFTIDERDDTYSQGENYYRSTVLTPLVSRWDCYESRYGEFADVAFCWMPTFVSGRDFVRYRQDGKEGSFIIDYGDGSCDSKITIIENNVAVKVDLANKSTISLLQSR
jgi:hypothetical protein